MTQTDQDETLADDLLQGAAAVSTFIFGDPKQRRRIYWLAENRSLPLFKIGETVCGRRSTLREWISQQERAGIGA
jgi:hypothetical protein